MKQSRIKPPKSTSSVPNQINLQKQLTKDKSGKENTTQDINVKHPNLLQSKLQLQKYDQQPTLSQGRQRFKSNGGNRTSAAIQRPSTVLNQSKLPSPSSELKIIASAQQRSGMHSTLNNTGKLNEQHGQSIMSPGEDSSRFDNYQHSKSKYSSTRGKQDPAITGKRVVQPKLIVGQASEIPQSSDRFNRLSPSRAVPTQILHQSKRKISKKSKSQTIQATSSQNLKNSMTGRVQKPRQFMDFLNTNMLHAEIHGKDQATEDEKEQTLKILNSSAAHIGQKHEKSRQNSSADRKKVQMKYLNFHRKNVINKNPTKGSKDKGRCVTQIREHKNERINLNKTQSTSADRIHRFAGSMSPKSKTGSAISRHHWANEIGQPNNIKDKSKSRDGHLLTKSAVEMTSGTSEIRLDRQALRHDSDLSIKTHYKKSQNNSQMQGQNDQSHLQMIPPRNQRSGPDVKKHKTSISPERAQKINQIIRINIKKEIQAQLFKRKEIKEREASSRRRKNLLQQKNQQIRRLNNERVQRRKNKLRENDDYEQQRDNSETKLLEEALLAVSDGVGQSDEFDLKKLQQRIKSVMEAMPQTSHNVSLTQHGHTQGMDFIDVRKEIILELKAAGSDVKGRASKMSKSKLECSWNDSVLNLPTSKSQKQDFVPLRSHQIHHTSLSLNQQPQNLVVKKPNNLTQIKNENMLTKRDKIRKFMKEKACMMKTKAEKHRVDEIKTIIKVRGNLTKLNDFVHLSKKHISTGMTTPALRVKRSHKKGTDYDATRRHHERNTTPSRAGGLFEQSDVSLNISAKMLNRGQHTQKDIQKLHDTLYEDSKLCSIDAQEISAKRKTEGNKNVLSVCFEKSASQKAFRKQIRNNHSPQILKARNQSSGKPRPRSAMSLLGSSKQNFKRKIKPMPKRLKSSTKRFILQREGKSTSKTEDDDMILNLKFSDQAAAVIIQKEVRKFLGGLGFYEARLQGEQGRSERLYSPDRQIVNGSQIDIFMYPKSNISSKSQSPLIARSRSKSPNSKSPTYKLMDPTRLSRSSVKMQISPQQLDLIKSFHDQSKQSKIVDIVGKPNSQVPTLWGLQSNSTPISQHNYSDKDLQSQSSSVFDRNSFQQFSQQRLTQLMKNNEYQKLIQFREECLEFREKKENKLINKLLNDKQMTPKTYKNRQQQIEKWVTLQKEEIEQTKLGFQEEWDKTVQMIEETQKNVDFTKIKLQNGDSNTYSQASSRQNNHQNKPPRSVFIDQAPKSYRSGQHEPHQVKISDADPSQGMLTSRESEQIDDLINLQIHEQNSKSAIKQPNQPSDLNLIKQQLSMTGEKPKDHERFGGENSLMRSSSGGDLDPMPSNEFINRLEQAANHMLPRDSKIDLLNIEEHSYTDDLDGQFADGNFKNQVVQMSDINKLFADGSQGNSDAQSDNKSEPMMFDGNKSEDKPFHQQLKISDMLKNNEIKQSLNFQEEDKPADPPSIEEEPSHFIQAVVKKEVSNDVMADKITEALMEQILNECLNIPNRKKHKSAPPALPEQEIYSFEQFSIEKEEKKEWIEIRQRHLIEANLIRADQYVNELVDVLLQFDISDISENSEFDYQIKPSDNFHIQFLKLLTQPIQRPPSDSLALMQRSELGSYIHFETTLDASKHPIVSVDLYLQIEKAREESMQERKVTADPRKLQIWESIHIYNKCIFDSVNESLMKFRPYGIVGQPMPWSNKVRRLQTKVEIASVDTERLFQMVKQEIFRWSQVFCGCLPGPEFSFPNPRTGKEEFQADLHQEVRERRLTSILTQDTVEQEHHWLNYEFEEAQVKVDLSDMILEHLVGEIISLLGEEEQEEGERRLQ